MYRILVNKKDYTTNTLEVTVFVLHYDIENEIHAPLPNEAPFFLDFLLHHYVKEDSYIRKLTENYRPYSTAFLSNHSSIFIKNIEQVAVRNAPFTKWLKKYHKKYIPIKDSEKLVQADYTIFLNNALFMDHVYEGFSYNLNCHNVPANIIPEKYYSSIPNIEHLIEVVRPTYRDNDKAVQVKISSNNDYTFFTYESNKLSIIEHNTWLTYWDTSIEDGYYKIFEDKSQNIIGLIDFNEVNNAFDIKTGAKINYTEKVDYFLSSNLNIMTHLEENTPLQISDKYNNLLLSIPENKNAFQTLAFSNDESLLAIVYSTHIDIWNIKNKSLIKSIFFEKGVWQKIIFSPDNNVIFGLVNNNIIYGLAIEEEHIIFQYQETALDFSIQDFDISEKYFTVLKSNRIDKQSSFEKQSCNIYAMNFTPLQIDNLQLYQFEKEAKENREKENIWAKFLLTIEDSFYTSVYISALKKNLHAYWEWINLAIQLEQKRLYEQALECLKIALIIRPNEQTGLFNLGTVYMNMKEYSSAAYYLEIVVKKKPFYNGGYINLAMVYLKSKQLNKCKEVCINGINIIDIPQCYINLGHAYYVQNQIQEAKDIYLKGLQKYTFSSSFVKDMLDDYDVMKIYNIAENSWSNFVHSLIEN